LREFRIKNRRRTGEHSIQPRAPSTGSTVENGGGKNLPSPTLLKSEESDCKGREILASFSPEVTKRISKGEKRE